MGNRIKNISLAVTGLIVTGGLVFLALQNPFPKLNISDGVTHLVVVILEIPEVPNPKTTEYSDCLSVAKVQVLKVMEGGGCAPRNVGGISNH